MNRRFKQGFTLVEIMIVVLIIGVLTAIATPNIFNARANSQKNSCITNLKRIEMAKEQWAMANNKGSTASPTVADLVGDPANGFLKSVPECPAGGGAYTIGNMSTEPTCTKASEGHTL